MQNSEYCFDIIATQNTIIIIIITHFQNGNGHFLLKNCTHFHVDTILVIFNNIYIQKVVSHNVI